MTQKPLPKEGPKEFGESKDDRLADLMGDVFGSGRLRILRALSSGPARFTDIARRVGGSESEASRNLHRSQEAGLVAKEADGTFIATPLGRATLALAPTLGVLAQHRSFFSTHAVDSLPRPLLSRLDEISSAQLVSDPFAIVAAVESQFRNVKTHFYGLWILGKPLLSQQDLAIQKVLRERIDANKADARAILLPEELAVLRAGLRNVDAAFVIRTVPRAPYSLMVSDAGALLQLADATGRIDFNHALVGDDTAFKDWCRDLFLETWAGSDAPVPASESDGKR